MTTQGPEGLPWRQFAAEFVGTAVLVGGGLSWLPLLVLSLLEGRAWSGIPVPFLKDIDVQTRLLVALPLLIAAEKIVHERLLPAPRLFVEKGLVRSEDRARFDEIVSSTTWWCNSVAVEVSLLVTAATLGHLLWMDKVSLHGEAWYARTGQSSPVLSLAGAWYAWISIPIFQFILVRWWFRLLLWWRFLFLVSRLDLVLQPAHPDRCGGLGLLGICADAFGPLLTAQSALVAALVGNRVIHQGAHLQDFNLQLLGILALCLLQVLGPLLFFGPGLLEARHRGHREYGMLADRYVREFERKWLHGGAPPDEPLLGSNDISALCDLGGSFQVVREMQMVPFGKEHVFQLAVMTALPAIPLLLIVVPLDVILKSVVGLLA